MWEIPIGSYLLREREGILGPAPGFTQGPRPAAGRIHIACVSVEVYISPENTLAYEQPNIHCLWSRLCLLCTVIGCFRDGSHGNSCLGRKFL